MLDSCGSGYCVSNKVWRVDNGGEESWVYPFFGSEDQQFRCADSWAVGRTALSKYGRSFPYRTSPGWKAEVLLRISDARPLPIGVSRPGARCSSPR